MPAPARASIFPRCQPNRRSRGRPSQSPSSPSPRTATTSSSPAAARSSRRRRLGQRTAHPRPDSGGDGDARDGRAATTGGRPRGGDHRVQRARESRAARRRDREHAAHPCGSRARHPALPSARRHRAAAPGAAPRSLGVGAAHPRRVLSRRSRQARARCAEAPALQDPARPRVPAGLHSTHVRRRRHATSSSRRWTRCAATSRSSRARSRPERSTRTASRSTTSRRITPRTYGSLIRTRYGEPYFTTEMMRVDDVGSLEVATF